VFFLPAVNHVSSNGQAAPPPQVGGPKRSAIRNTTNVSFDIPECAWCEVQADHAD